MFYFRPSQSLILALGKLEQVELKHSDYCFLFREGYFVNCEGLGGYCGDYGYPYLHDSYNLVGYTVPNIDRISLWGLGLVSNLYVKEIPGVLVGYDCILSIIPYSVRIWTVFCKADSFPYIRRVRVPLGGDSFSQFIQSITHSAESSPDRSRVLLLE